MMIKLGAISVDNEESISKYALKAIYIVRNMTIWYPIFFVLNRHMTNHDSTMNTNSELRGKTVIKVEG